MPSSFFPQTPSLIAFPTLDLHNASAQLIMVHAKVMQSTTNSSVFLKVKYQHDPTNLSYFFFIQSKLFIRGYKWFKPLILMLLHHHRKNTNYFFFDKENKRNFNNTTHILINIHINYRPFGKIQNWLLQCLTWKM